MCWIKAVGVAPSLAENDDLLFSELGKQNQHTNICELNSKKIVWPMPILCLQGEMFTHEAIKNTLIPTTIPYYVSQPGHLCQETRWGFIASFIANRQPQTDNSLLTFLFKWLWCTPHSKGGSTLFNCIAQRHLGPFPSSNMFNLCLEIECPPPTDFRKPLRIGAVPFLLTCG